MLSVLLATAALAADPPPPSVAATLVKMQLPSRLPIALGFDLTLVPGATPKKPASGLIA